MLNNVLYTPEFNSLILGAGLNDLWNSVRDNWIGPVFFAAVAVGAFMFIKSQQITKLIMFLVVASLVGVLIFFGDALFGANGSLSRMFKGTSTNVGNSNSDGI
jgi:asparagine N-glycosylation enzyme membrane subunit Stt3